MKEQEHYVLVFGLKQMCFSGYWVNHCLDCRYSVWMICNEWFYCITDCSCKFHFDSIVNPLKSVHFLWYQTNSFLKCPSVVCESIENLKFLGKHHLTFRNCPLGSGPRFRLSPWCRGHIGFSKLQVQLEVLHSWREWQELVESLYLVERGTEKRRPLQKPDKNLLPLIGFHMFEGRSPWDIAPELTFVQFVFPHRREPSDLHDRRFWLSNPKNKIRRLFTFKKVDH